MKKIISYFKRKRIVAFRWFSYIDQFQIGIHGGLYNIGKDDGYPEYNVRHGHIWIDLGFRCIEITFMELRDED